MLYQTIRPAKTYIKTLIPKKNGFTVKAAEKKAQTSGYQIQYSTDKSFASGSTRNVWIKSSSSGAKEETVCRTVGNQKAGKKYFVRIRTYKNIPPERAGGKSMRYYSVWSAAKQVTVQQDS